MSDVQMEFSVIAAEFAIFFAGVLLYRVLPPERRNVVSKLMMGAGALMLAMALLPAWGIIKTEPAATVIDIAGILGGVASFSLGMALRHRLARQRNKPH